MWPIALLLAAMASPVVGAPRPLESLRLVVSIQWLSRDDAAIDVRIVDRPAVTPAQPSSQVSRFGAPDSRARSTALPRSSFQRPPPPASLHS